jgi:hypothetical protein
MFVKEYCVRLELRDLIWIEMILAERQLCKFSAHQYGLNPQGLGEAVHALKLLSLYITYALDYFEAVATAHHPQLDLEGITKNRHKSYGETHPFTLIRPYLDPAMLHIYLDLFPGLDEMDIGWPFNSQNAECSQLNMNKM